MASDWVIQTAGLTKIFRDFWGHQRVIAVDSLDLEIAPQEVFGLLGPNGSGKSTTIKMLLGLLFPSKGWAKVLGQPPGDVKSNQRIGYLPEDSHLYPFLSARETLDFYGRLFGLSLGERRERIDSLLDMVGLAGVGRRPVGEFSKGMARRIGLAQALINDPDILILDEPTSGLDPIGTKQIKDLIRELGRRGKTVLLCSHLLADVEDVCDRICILYGGRIQSQGPVDDLLAMGDKTQIRSNHLSDAAIEKIKEIIRAEHGDDGVEVETPRTRLEDVFLDIVTQAQAQEQGTSGAMIGSGVSDFLSVVKPQESDTQELLNELVAGKKESQPVPSESEDAELAQHQELPLVTVEKTETVQKQVLESLVEPLTNVLDSSVAKEDSLKPKTPESFNESVEPKVLEIDSDTVDRSVIDDLLGGTKNKKTPSSDQQAEENTGHSDNE